MTNFSELPIDYSWSFSDKTIKDTSYITHGYYTYPAKFIPQVASRLITENSFAGDIIVDPFMGSGTTIVEAIVNNRIGIGTDINEIAFLLAKVKTTPLEMTALAKEYDLIQQDLDFAVNWDYGNAVKSALEKIPDNERIDYWFLPQQKEKLAIIFARLLSIENENIRNFYFVAFAQILKSASIWLQKSVKPTRDMKKKIYDPIALFSAQAKKMLKKHSEFNALLKPSVLNDIDSFRKVQCADSRCIPCEDGKASLIVTSPPYVTSYEYADLHQLPLLWFGFMKELHDFRQKFIGSSYKKRDIIDLKSSIANGIISQLKNKKRDEVQNYYADMLETFEEIKRVLKSGGRACVVICDTEFQGIKIKNAQVFQEQFENIGFKTNKIIKREIPSKMLPSTRDSETGRFGKASDKNIKQAYPTEYILIMEKI